MEKETNLPSKVGELAEAKIFQFGFAGAWFRCKITEFSKRKGEIGYALEYYDFPDEKLKWMKLCQLPHLYEGKGEVRHRELMIRPPYPCIYSEDQMPDVNMISEVAMIVNNSWKIELKPPRFGEGSVYEAHYEDLRPSLDWAPESGWTVRTQDGDTGTTCFRVIKPINRVQEAESIQATAGPSFSSPVTSKSLASSDEVNFSATAEMKKQSTVSNEVKNIEEKNSSLGCEAPDTDSVQISAETNAAHEVANENDQKYEAGYLDWVKMMRSHSERKWMRRAAGSYYGVEIY